MVIIEYLKKHKWGLFFALILGAFSYKVIIFLHFDRIGELAMMSYSPINGEAFWRAFQNRFLSAWLIQLLMYVGLSMEWSFKIWFLIILVTTNLVLYVTFVKLKVEQTRIYGILILFNLLFILVQDHKWILLWDVIDILLFVLFYYGLLSSKSFFYFTLLFLIGIVNREVVLYFALWFIIDGAYPLLTHPKSYDFKKIIFGGALLTIGGIYTTWSRATFFVRSYAPEVGYDLRNEAIGNHWNIENNIQSFIQNITSVQLDMLGTVFIVFIGAVFWTNRARLDDFLKKLGIQMLAMILAVWIFGLINETRHYLIFIPGFTVLVYKLYNKEKPMFYL